MVGQWLWQWYPFAKENSLNIEHCCFAYAVNMIMTCGCFDTIGDMMKAVYPELAKNELMTRLISDEGVRLPTFDNPLTLGQCMD